MQCPETAELASFLGRDGGFERHAAIEEHLDVCCECARLVASAIRGEGGTGALVGERYRLMELLGEGGMGSVYRAHDRFLDRTVAVKLIHFRAPGLEARAEARAMARLAHPNVVPVFDTGIFDGGQYIAMQVVEGTTLRAWLAARPRTAQEVLAVFADVGEGLAAAHDAGIIHRDFKPSNALVTTSGRAMVTDFGLALQGEPSDHGGVVGTPAYMSPEQRAGRTVDERSDQFAFCVALLDALPRPIPRHIARWLRRGLDRDPRRRWPSMRALLGALARPRRRNAWLFAAVAAALLPACIALAGASGSDVHPPAPSSPSSAARAAEPPTTASTGPLQPPLSPAVADAMARLLGRMQRDRVLAPSFVRRALGPALALDAPAVLARARRVYADALRTSGEDARSTALLEQAFADSEAVGAVNEAFETAIRLAWVRARAGHPSAAAWIARARRLAPQCEDPTRAGRRVTLQHGILLGEQGDFDAALEVLQPLLDELPPGDALREEGITALGLTTLNASQNTDRAEALLREAYRLQVEQTSGPSLRVASGLHNLAIVEIERHDFHAALSLLEESLSEGREAGGTLHSLARTEEARASAVAYVEGWEAGARAFARVESAIASNPSMRLALVNLASSRCRAAQQLAPEAEAIQHCRVAWMRSRDYAPPGSMHGLMAANSYALVLLRLQSFGAAEAVLREALAASETEGLREHAVRAGLLNNLGRTHVGLDRGAEALDAFTKAKRIVDTVGGDNPMRAIVTFNLGRELARQGRVAAARQELLRARAHIDTMAAPPDLRVAIERALADVDAREARAG